MQIERLLVFWLVNMRGQLRARFLAIFEFGPSTFAACSWFIWHDRLDGNFSHPTCWSLSSLTSLQNDSQDNIVVSCTHDRSACLGGPKSQCAAGCYFCSIHLFARLHMDVYSSENSVLLAHIDRKRRCCLVDFIAGFFGRRCAHCMQGYYRFETTCQGIQGVNRQQRRHSWFYWIAEVNSNTEKCGRTYTLVVISIERVSNVE